MRTHCPRADRETHRDLFVGMAERHQLNDFQLTLSRAIVRLSALHSVKYRY